MGQVRQINGTYYIEFYARGLLYSQIAGDDPEEAQRLLARIEATIAGGEALTIVRHIELVDFFQCFLEESRKLYPASKTPERFTSVIRHFSDFLSQDFPQMHQLAQLTPAIIESYKIFLAKTQQPKIVNLTDLLLKDVLEFGIKLGFINDNPTLHLRLLPWPKVDRKLTKRYAQAEQLLSQGIGLAKLTLLLNMSDVSKTIYFAHLIPLSRQDMYR